MRSRSLVLLLALAGTALSGCASGFDDAYINSFNIADGPGGDGLSGDEPSGEDNGGQLPGGTGSTTLVFTDGSRVVDGTSRTRLTISPDNTNPTSATVLVDPKERIGFIGEQTLATFIAPTTDTRTNQMNAAAFNWFGTAGNTTPHQVDNSTYTEFRRISPAEGIDAELQYWNFTAGSDSYVAHFRDANQDQDAWFFGSADPANSTQTTTDQYAALGTGTLSYEGSYAGQAKAEGWGQASSYQTQNGPWRTQGHASVTLDLDANTLSGTLTPQFWEKTESDGTVVQIDVHRQSGDEYLVTSGTDYDPATPPVAAAADIAAFHRAQVQLQGTVTDGVATGKATVVDAGTNGGWVNGDQALNAAAFGANAEQITGVFSVYAVKPQPQGGDTGINDDRRGVIDLQGGFGVCQGCTGITPVPAPLP
jgi:hypothetical protein